MPAEFAPYSSFSDNSFSEELTQNYTLVCVIGLSSYSFCIYHKQQLIAVEEIGFKNTKNETELIQLLNTIILDKQWLKGKFKEITVVFENNQNTLVPLPLFDTIEAETYLKFNQSIPEKSLVKLNVLKSVQSVNIFSINETLYNYFENCWNEIKILQFSTVLIESLANQFKHEIDNNTLFINLRDDSFDVIYFKNKKLFFNNNFKFKTKEDFVYFLLISAEQLGLNTQENLFMLSGKIDNQSEKFLLLEKYIHNIRFLFPASPLTSKLEIDDFFFNRHFVLFNALQCE